jgi:hypothetical protein
MCLCNTHSYLRFVDRLLFSVSVCVFVRLRLSLSLNFPCHFLYLVICCCVFRQYLIGATGVRAVLAAMRNHFTVPEVAQRGCLALGTFAVNDPDHQTVIVEAGGVDAVFSSLCTHAQVPAVAEWGCYALGQLALNHKRNQTTISEVGGVDVVLAAMRKHAMVPIVVQWGCFALGSLALNHPDNQTVIGAAGGLDVILAAMRNHAVVPEGRRVTRMIAGHACIHAAVPEVGAHGCLALGKLASNHRPNQLAIGAAGGVDVVLATMRHHPLVLQVQDWGTFSLEQLMTCSANQVKFMECGGEAVVRTAMATHPGTPVVNQAKALLKAVRVLPV